MIERRTIVSRVEAERDGVVFVELARQVVDGDAVLTSTAHRFPIAPGETPGVVFEAIDANFAAAGEPTVDPLEWSRVVAVAMLVQTEPVIAAWQARQAALAEAEAQG